MNPESLAELRAFVTERMFRVADLGSRFFNGSVKELLPNATGFDIVPGPNVDIVLTSGRVPVECLHDFDLVTAIGSLQCAPDPDAFRNEAFFLLKRGGCLYILTCTPACTMRHTAPDEAPDRNRFTSKSIGNFLSVQFDVVSVRELSWHPILECVARSK